MTKTERAARMMQISLEAAIWADGRMTRTADLEKLAKDLQTLQADAEELLLEIERSLPAPPPPAL